MLIVINNNYHNSTAFNSANIVTANVYGAYNSIAKYFSLEKTNQYLAKENAFLRTITKESYVIYNEKLKLNIDTNSTRKYRYISAQVLNNSVTFQDNYLTLDKGQRDGIRVDMGVIGPNGVVGVVKDVSENFCTVISVLNSNLKVSARIKRNNFFGSLYWDGISPSEAKLSDIPIHVKVFEGDTLVTSGYSSIFPSDVMIGTITTFDKSEGSNFYDIDVDLSTEFRNLSFVYIIDNILQNEQVELENKLKVSD